MKKRVKRLGVVALAVVIMAVLTGCGTEKVSASASKNQEVHVAVVLGAQVNSPCVNLKLIQDVIYQACYSQGSVTLVVDDGEPYCTAINIPSQEKHLSKSKYDQIAKKQTKKILKLASSMKSRTADVDSIKSVQRAARALNSVEQKGKGDTELVRKLIICDNLLSTTGVLSFVDYNLNTANEGDITTQLKKLDEIPQLDGISVTAYNVGDTAGQQKSLPETSRKNLKAIWNSIFEAGSAKKVQFKDNLPLSSTYNKDSMPTVSPITVVQSSMEIHDTEDVNEAFADGGVLNFDETSIAFHEGTAELADEESASKALQYVTEYMNQYPDFKLVVCGTTACWGGEDYCKKLSLERADTVCELLVKEGIDRSRIKSAGVGYSFADFYTYDQKPDGELDETIAKTNRSVKLVDWDSDTADRILKLE